MFLWFRFEFCYFDKVSFKTFETFSSLWDEIWGIFKSLAIEFEISKCFLTFKAFLVNCWACFRSWIKYLSFGGRPTFLGSDWGLGKVSFWKHPSMPRFREETFFFLACKLYSSWYLGLKPRFDRFLWPRILFYIWHSFSLLKLGSSPKSSLYVISETDSLSSYWSKSLYELFDCKLSLGCSAWF